MGNFDRIERRLQEATFRKLSNALAVFSSAAHPVPVIFANAFVDPGGIGVASSQPQMLCQSADVPDVAYGERVEMGETVYRIVGIEPDGLGETLFRLERT
jgi:hypothetical protein